MIALALAVLALPGCRDGGVGDAQPAAPVVAGEETVDCPPWAEGPCTSRPDPGNPGGVHYYDATGAMIGAGTP